jgi:hypothetical protein
MFAGFGDEEDEWDEEEMDLSGWMSRSDPDDFGGVTEEPPVRPRNNPKAESIGSQTNPQMAFTPPMQNIGYVANPVSFSGPFNPLYAHDQAVWNNPKIAVGTKIAGLSVFGVTAIYALGKAVQFRSDRDVDGIGEGIREALGNNYNFPGKILVMGSWLYLAPALGMAHGALAKVLPETGLTWHSAGKVAVHAGLILPTFYFLRR